MYLSMLVVNLGKSRMIKIVRLGMLELGREVEDGVMGTSEQIVSVGSRTE